MLGWLSPYLQTNRLSWVHHRINTLFLAADLCVSLIYITTVLIYHSDLFVTMNSHSLFDFLIFFNHIIQKGSWANDVGLGGAMIWASDLGM